LNTTLREEDVRTNRGMRKATFEERGLDYAGDLTEQNCQGLKRILKWNLDHGIHFYRIASDLLPWFSQYYLNELPNATVVQRLLGDIGTLACEHDVRLTFHPDHFVKLASDKPGVVDRAIVDLENHGAMLDTMGLPRTPCAGMESRMAAVEFRWWNNAIGWPPAFTTVGPSSRSAIEATST
jgi:UV DNA damage endonuclease